MSQRSKPTTAGGQGEAVSRLLSVLSSAGSPEEAGRAACEAVSALTGAAVVAVYARASGETPSVLLLLHGLPGEKGPDLPESVRMEPGGGLSPGLPEGLSRFYLGETDVPIGLLLLAEGHDPGPVGPLLSATLRRIEAERALADSRGRLRALLEQSSDGIWCYELEEPVSIDLPVDEQIRLIDRHSVLAECSDSLARMYGRESGSVMLGQRRTDSFGDPVRLGYLRSFIENGYRIDGAETVEEAADGAPRYFLNSLVGSVKDGRLVRLWGMQRDITGQRIATLEARDREKRLLGYSRKLIELSGHLRREEPDLAALSGLVCSGAMEATGLDNVSVWVFEESGTEVAARPLAFCGDSPPTSGAPAIISPSEMESLRGQRVLRLLTDASGMQDSPGSLGALVLSRSSSAVICPVLVGGGIRGALVLEGSRDELRAGFEDESFFTGLADIVSGGIESGETARARLMQSCVYRIADAALSTRQLDELFESIHAIVADVMSAENVYIALYDEETGMLSFPYIVDRHETSIEPRKASGGLTEYVIRTGRPLLATAETFRRLESAGEIEMFGVEPRNWLGVPLRLHDRTIGVLAVQSYDEESTYSADQEEILRFVSNQIAMAIDRRRSYEAVRRSEQLNRALVERSPLGISVRSRTGRLLYANEAWKKIWAMPEERYLQDLSRSREALQFDDRDRYLGRGLDRLRKVYEEGGELYMPELELSGSRPGGARFISQHFYAIMDDEERVDRVVILTEDITQRKQAEEALRDSEQKHRLLVEKAGEGILIIQDSIIRFVNPYMTRLTGLSADEITGKCFLDFVEPSEREELRRRYENRAENREEADPLEVTIIDSEGRRISSEVAMGVLGYEGRAAELVIIRDITERKRSEESRRKLEEQIRHTQKLESLGVLAGGIAHDFNNLLIGIMGNAGLALMEMSPDSPARKTVERIEKASLRAAELTNQLLAYSGKGKFVVEPIDLSSLVEEMGDLLRAALSKSAALELDLADSLPAFEADGTQIRQVVMNLIMNASEALGDSAGHIVLRTGRVHADAELLSRAFLSEGAEEGEYVFLEVEDDGCGIEPGTLSRVFDPFYTTKFAGRGLGLAAVLGVVRGHRGAIFVGSSPGKGSSFRVLFRCSAQREPEPAAREVRTAMPSPGGGIAAPGEHLVLVVDDEEEVRDTARQILKRFGLAVVTASDGREGLDVYRRRWREISVVLLDMTMPGMSGEQALIAMREINPSARVLLTSGYSEQHAVAQLNSKSVSGFIQKPYRPAELVERIRAILGDESRRN
ncbi:PAS domain S-box protein [Candidatus Fermentibacterales bacterium]|nr:PAS domain S-box protein [Candidatus Fermentibacterales bacterium]